MTVNKPFTVRRDGQRYEVVYSGLTETPIKWYSTQSAAEADAEWRNAEAECRLRRTPGGFYVWYA